MPLPGRSNLAQEGAQGLQSAGDWVLMQQGVKPRGPSGMMVNDAPIFG